MEKDFNKRLRNFGFSFACKMVILFIIGYFKNFNKIFLIIVITLAIYNLFFAIIYPKMLVIIFYPIDFIAKIIGNFITFLIFTVVFFVFFTPISFILRISGKDQIKKLSFSPKWINVKEEENNPERVEKLY
ncbi:MAG TPA: SxtJ family membrane protein [Spirochaetota bacterium]|nr:SxtJ family membrane protein [Spirochaetota bacterium]